MEKYFDIEEQVELLEESIRTCTKNIRKLWTVKNTESFARKLLEKEIRKLRRYQEDLSKLTGYIENKRYLRTGLIDGIIM